MKNRKRKKKVTGSLKPALFTLALCALCFITSAQTTGTAQSKQQYYEQKKQVALPIPEASEKRIYTSPGKNVVPVTKNELKCNPSVPQIKKAATMDELRIAKKQAADKSLPTTSIDEAMKIIITNQTK